MTFYQQEYSTPIEKTTIRQFIFHVDLDCFFAAVEMREDPSLVGKPIMVGGDKETKRGIVTTCNYEARKFGVHSGMSAKEAIELCPEIICVRRGHYDLYRDVSDNIMAILSSYTEEFRSASIDEAYLNLTDIVEEEYNGYPIPLAEEIKNEIFEAEKITCSIGIGPNTTIAKIATGRNKPNGITYVPKQSIHCFLTPLSVSAISGIGPKTAESLKRKYNIEKIGQIIEIGSEHELIRKFGRLGSFFYKVVSGQGRTKIQPNSSFGVKSISKGSTFHGQMFDGEPVTIDMILPKLIDQVHDRLIKKTFRYKTVTLDVRFQDNFQNITRSRSFLAANDDIVRLKVAVYDMLEEINNDFNNAKIRKAAVRVSNFVKQDPQQKPITAYFA
ncbi:MAG: DNA polymerase IV [Candidatus Heimdallarchaeota archaeon]|nr:DNA polymerase IV [Candidatus Heimdallarchaeota archaeon]